MIIYYSRFEGKYSIAQLQLTDSLTLLEQSIYLCHLIGITFFCLPRAPFFVVVINAIPFRCNNAPNSINITVSFSILNKFRIRLPTWESIQCIVCACLVSQDHISVDRFVHPGWLVFGLLTPDTDGKKSFARHEIHLAY